MDTNTNLVIQYAKTTQTICLCLGEALILCLLAYMMYYNIQQTNQFANSFNITFLNINDNWGPIKTNVLCSYLYTVFLFFLTVSVFYA